MAGFGINIISKYYIWKCVSVNPRTRGHYLPYLFANYDRQTTNEYSVNKSMVVTVCIIIMALLVYLHDY